MPLACDRERAHRTDRPNTTKSERLFRATHDWASLSCATGCRCAGSQESLSALAKRYGLNQKSVAKWKERKTKRLLARNLSCQRRRRGRRSGRRRAPVRCGSGPLARAAGRI
ncbi:MAG: hypothetical protein GEU89_17615 [Kiloniellaceae bacterium]|nr:hypothetical protein [Kiloniellaceae bacterium]